MIPRPSASCGCVPKSIPSLLRSPTVLQDSLYKTLHTHTISSATCWPCMTGRLKAASRTLRLGQMLSTGLLRMIQSTVYSPLVGGSAMCLLHSHGMIHHDVPI